MRALTIFALVALVFGCSSTQNLGIITRESADPGKFLSSAQSYSELGPVKGQSCRYIVVALIPFGDSTPTAAMEKALTTVGGDALINASVTTSLYTFVPIYNVFNFTCTTVRGTAVKFGEQIELVK